MAFKKYHVITFFLFVVMSGCNTITYSIRKNYKSLSKQNRKQADSILLMALDHEALYTLADTLKPISSIKLYRLPLLSSNASQKDSARNVLQQIQYIANTLSNKHFQFIVNPFERTDSIYKNIELYVARNTILQKKIEQYKDFYGNLGIVSNTNPSTVLSITEFEQKYIRWRSYGYLFGYPTYAVDFFVEAGKEQDSTKQFVKRDFFAIPVYTANSGYFTYAIPKNHQPTLVDSTIYKNALITLEKYKRYRKKYTNTRGTKSVKLWMKLL